MSKTYDELIKLLDAKGEVPDEDAKKLIEEHGPLSDEEKKQLAEAIKARKEKKADEKKPEEPKPEEKKPDPKPDEKKGEGGEVSMEDYLMALSILDSTDASADEKKKAEATKTRFESQ